jgi:hypothetical protein
MTSTTDARPNTLATHRVGALTALVGLLGAASGAYLAGVEPAVAENRFSYPLAADSYVGFQSFFAIQHVFLVLGLVALAWTGVAGTSRTARYGHGAAVLGMATLACTEVLAMTASTALVDSDRAGLLGACYGFSSILNAGGLIAVGTAIVRERRWRSWQRWLVLAMGVWVFVPMMPALMVGGDVARLAIGAWMLLWTLLGLLIVRHEA